MEVTTDLIPLAFECVPIRCLAFGNHSELVAADVCAALKLKEPAHVLAILAPDETVTRTAVVLGGRQKLVTLTSAGLDNLLSQSQKTRAKRFKRWLSREIPSAISLAENPLPQTENNGTEAKNDGTEESPSVAASQHIQKLHEKLELATLAVQESQKALFDANERALWAERMNEFRSREVLQHLKTIDELTKQLQNTQKEFKQCQSFILQAAHALGMKAMEIQGDSDK